MLYLYFHKGNKKIYVLNQSFSVFKLFIITLPILLLGMLFVFIPVVIGNNSGISIPPNYQVAFLLSLAVYVIALFFGIVKAINLLQAWYVEKSSGYLGYIKMRTRKDQLSLYKGRENIVHLISTTSAIISSQIEKGYNISIRINEDKIINLCDYYGGDIISVDKIVSGARKKTARVYEVDELLSQFLNLPLKKNYDDTVTNKNGESVNMGN